MSSLILLGVGALAVWLLVPSEAAEEGDLVIPRPKPNAPTARSGKATALTRAMCDIRDVLTAIGKPEIYTSVAALLNPVLLDLIGGADV